MKLRPSWWIGALSVAALVAAAGVWTRTSAKDPAQDLATAAVVRGDIEDAVSALGFLQPQEFVDVGTQVSGQLKRLRVAVGDSVEKGAVLAEIDTAVLTAKVEAGQATLQSLAAQIDEKQAQLALATRQQQRNATMFAQDIVSRDALETSQAATRVTAAQVASLKAQRQQTGAALRIDQTNLGYANILAPMAGTVVALNARQGQTLNASQQAPILMRLARLDTMTVVTQVSEADVVRLKAGTEVYFNTLGQPDRRWTGSVRQVMPTPDTVNNVVLYNVLFDVANTDRQLMTQMSAQVFFVLAQAEGALLVPVAALGAVRAVHDVKAGDTKTARVRVLKDGSVEERKVGVGVMTRLSAQVVSGLVEGEQVVLGSASASEPKRDAKPKDGTRRVAKP
jgi:membrane fusion protein, macrolide-specific efflux system